MNTICFPKNTFYTSSFILFILIAYYIFIFYNKYKDSSQSTFDSIENLKSRLKIVHDKLSNSLANNKICNSQLLQCTHNLSQHSIHSSSTSGPERDYISTRTTSDSYSIVGYVYKDSDRFPLYARHKYPGRNDRWEYYVIDESRNRLKIPFTTTNYIELHDGDSIDIPSLGDSFSVKIYDYQSFRYNPNI